ncbi:MAG: hypothetical protein LBR80_18555 [Deltaproteobacteria bacterium]|jgi:hypothetical protein|nr:hypothetical protein [Deltaproteobacteria bacterium]
MPEPQGRLVYWPLIAPWGPPRDHEGEAFYLSFPSWESYLAGGDEGGSPPFGLPAPPGPAVPGFSPLLAPDPPNFLRSLASLWQALADGEPPFGALALRADDPPDSLSSIRNLIRNPHDTLFPEGPGSAPEGNTRPPFPPELVLALWTLGALSGWEADRHLREAARKNLGLLDALKGPLAEADAALELGYEAAGLSGLEGVLGAYGADAIAPSPASAAAGPGHAETAYDPEPDGGPTAFRAAAPSAANAALLRDLWLSAARPLLRPGDRLAASGSGFEGMWEGMFPPDPRHPGDFLYADL